MPGRSRRAGSAVLLLLAAALGAAGCGQAAVERSVPPREHASVEPTPTAGGTTPTAGSTALACGQPFRPPAGTGPLTVHGRFPASVPAGSGLVTGLVEVTSRVAARGVVAPHAQAFLVRDGRVASVPVPQDALGLRWELTPGTVERLPGEAALVSCEPGGHPLPAGTYQLYARVLFIPDDGTGLESFGGPWPLEVH